MKASLEVFKNTGLRRKQNFMTDSLSYSNNNKEKSGNQKAEKLWDTVKRPIQAQVAWPECIPLQYTIAKMPRERTKGELSSQL